MKLEKISSNLEFLEFEKFFDVGFTKLKIIKFYFKNSCQFLVTIKLFTRGYIPIWSLGIQSLC